MYPATASYELRDGTRVKEIDIKREADLDMSECEHPNITGNACQCRYTLTTFLHERLLDLMS